MIATPKQQVKTILEHLPEDCSLEDIQYHLYVLETIQRRLDLAASERLVPQSEAEAKLSKWLTP
jgi:hypothetical protein